MELLALVTADRTDPATVAAGEGFGTEIGKRTIVVRDMPGFAPAASVWPSAWRPSNQVGLDVRLDIARYLEGFYGDRFAPPKLLVEKVAAGETGRKSGKGFYDWPD